MPNWCDNTLFIVATNKHKLNMISKKLGLKKEMPELNFSSIVPEPKMQGNRYMDMDGSVPISGMPQWYGWRLQNWGTKWDVGILEIEPIFTEVKYLHKWDKWSDYETYGTEESPAVIVQFMTAWSPPTEFVQALAKKYPDVAIALQFSENGVGFEGELILTGEEEEYNNIRDMSPDVGYVLNDMIENINNKTREQENNTQGNFSQEKSTERKEEEK